ncbi:MAG: sugar phosphate isomerase/epimerase [Comamonadaceae bacterium]|nr:MAG: sugar phosphate isomerase/epimerase [Comamonadaceae bacterium]
MTQRILSISGAPYDGHPVPDMLASIAACGATHVEPAFIVGYTEPFDESSFSPAQTRQWQTWLAASGLGVDAMSSHIDLGRDDAVKVFKGRMDFAKALGARVINTNAAAQRLQRKFFSNIEVLARHAEAIGLQIGLENPGDGSDNLLNTAADAAGLLASINHPMVGLNYDAGNTISHRPNVSPADDALLAMPLCVHTHIKDVRVTPDGFFFTPLGEGAVDCARIVRAVAATALNLSIEIPLRLHRQSSAQPSRAPYRVPMGDIEAVIRPALAFVKQHLAPGEGAAS